MTNIIDENLHILLTGYLSILYHIVKCSPNKLSVHYIGHPIEIFREELNRLTVEYMLHK
jgi:hypothetical protein